MDMVAYSNYSVPFERTDGWKQPVSAVTHANYQLTIFLNKIYNLHLQDYIYPSGVKLPK